MEMAGRPRSGELQLQATNSKAFDAAAADRQPLRDLSPAEHILLPLAIFAISFVVVEFSRLSNFVMALWPTNAVILVALLRHGRSLRNYGSILVGGACAVALANFATGIGPALCVILGMANAVEAVITLALLSMFKIEASNLISFRNLLIFIVIAGGLVPLVSGGLGALAIELVRGIPWPTAWLHFYLTRALGMIIVVPFLLSVTSNQWQALHIRQRRAQAVAALGLVIAVALCAAYFRSLIFIIVPVILLATLRFGVIGATIATLVIAVIFTGFVVMGIGEPIVSRTELPERIIALQILMAFTSLWALPIAALLAERDRLLGDLSMVNSQLQVESERKSHMVVGLRRHLSIAEEKERLRLSYELHDQAGQSLVAAILELGEIDPLIHGAARERLQLVRKRMEEMGKTLHRIAWELRPPSIDELGLRKALASYIADWSEQCATEVDFHCDDPSLDQVPNEIGSAVYRVVQEALTNVVKHAQQPSNVSVVIRHVSGTLQVIIEDNGCGFDVSAAVAKTGGYRGLGLDGMRERLMLIGGTLEIESTTGAGTTIFARIPLDGQRSAA